ncbi:hypothetical protein PCAR4_990050 [Paraburkholderia caribensis]|nr:hypothetical protein PCAR4_990050 [Paraburkholderia caribensis]
MGRLGLVLGMWLRFGKLLSRGVFLSADAGGAFAFAYAGIHVLLSVLQALPLCGAAPTFLCRRKEK